MATDDLTFNHDPSYPYLKAVQMPTFAEIRSKQIVRAYFLGWVFSPSEISDMDPDEEFKSLDEVLEVGVRQAWRAKGYDAQFGWKHYPKTKFVYTYEDYSALVHISFNKPGYLTRSEEDLKAIKDVLQVDTEPRWWCRYHFFPPSN
ncbi:hypothetical protein L218DRAFT_1005208 [Marasmius fiardii PR-910]|nr:hypothetical protein L218DRAFT_1005208 [Marasmius fiardii PR-910]